MQHTLVCILLLCVTIETNGEEKYGNDFASENGFFWRSEKDESEEKILLWDNSIEITKDFGVLFFKRFSTSTSTLNGYFGQLLNDRSKETFSTIVTSKKLKIKFYGKNLYTDLVISKLDFHDNCYQIYWVSNAILKDCFDTKGSHWFGLGEIFNQSWPIDESSFKMTPFRTHDFLAAGLNNDNVFGGVLEPFIINSNGVGIYISDEIPVSVSMNANAQRKFCIQTGSKIHHPDKVDPPQNELKYTVCLAPNIKKVHKILMSQYIEMPKGYPDLKMLIQPIWSTWVLFKKKVNQSSIMAFADNIKKYKFPASQIEIDDMYSTAYGDFNFDPKKFNNIKKMISTLKSKGFRITAWVYPFCNVNANCFINSSKYWVQVGEPGHEVVGITKWWNGFGSMLDTTNKESVKWFTKRLKDFQKFGIDGFKFDAGELNYLPKGYKLSSKQRNSNYFSKYYVKLACDTGDLTEVRVAYKSQRYPVFVRILDRNTAWGFDNGLRSVLPAVLTFSILGYPLFCQI